MHGDLLYLLKYISNEYIEDLVLEVWFFYRLSFTNGNIHSRFFHYFQTALELLSSDWTSPAHTHDVSTYKITASRLWYTFLSNLRFLEALQNKGVRTR